MPQEFVRLCDNKVIVSEFTELENLQNKKR